jgi:tape measure domain-containing protein
MAKKNTVEIILAAKDRASKATQKAFGSVESAANKAMKGVGKAALAASAAVATVSGIVGKIGLDYNAMKEQSQIAWETILGSAEKAKTTLQELQTLGAQTPFEFEGLDKAGKLLTMAQLGGDKLKESLTSVGDAVSAIGGNQDTLEGVSMALFQMQAKGKIQAEEMMQMAERGLPVWDILAEKMGKSTEELMEMSSKGELLAKETVPLLVEGLGDRFGGAMEKQSKTFNGLMSTMRDNAKILAGVLTEGLFERVKGYLPPIIDMMERFTESFQAGGIKGVMEEFLPPGVVNAITTGMAMIEDGFNKVKNVFVQNKDQIVLVLAGLKGYFNFLVNYWSGWIDTIKNLFSGEGNIGQTFVRIFNVVKSIAVPILKDAIEFVKSIIGQLTQFWKENGDQIIQAVKNFASVVAAIFEFLAPVIKWIVMSLWENVKGVISGALKIIMGLIKVFAGLFTGDFSKMWEGVKQIFIGAVQGIWNLMNLLFVGKIIAGLKALGKGMLTNVQYYWHVVKDGFTKLATTATSKALGMVKSVLQWFGNLLAQARTTFSLLRQFGENIFRALWNTLRSVASNIYHSVRGYFSNLASSAGSIFSGLWSKAVNIFNRIKSAIISPITKAKDTVLGLIRKIKDAFNFSWSLPKLKLPHVSVSMRKGVGGIPYPDFDVNWYDKGGIFTGPSIIGVGEKRPEFVGALDDLKGIVRDVIREEGNGQGGIYEFHISIPIDGRELVRRTIRFTSEELERMKVNTGVYKGLNV